ncbi:ArsR/SmtB family transcription factor [Congzhengia minquanensis]|uniref:Helix-turn-helix transcriptional regulator n=1 Tax=Congzhengia minquanensis TaxID=2763657 RepID=A0A926HZV6_9FIRM|nr:helix-turn-helix transcriptional regulator [Congzhengia minquanensis]MBC8541565.1 helix-turn-helix transcriptional regulator [Congzhengia minquanensis]
MSQIRLLKEPGYIYDLLFIFYLRFNKQYYINMLENSGKQADVKFFNDILEKFSDIPDDLYVFFHAIENGRCFFATQYFNPYKEQFTTTYNFKLIQKELTDSDQLLRALIRFYFYEISDEKIDACMNSTLELFSLIKTSHYSTEVKSKLYEFFIHPEPYVRTLHFELIAKEFMLSQYYEKNYQKILDVYNQTTFEILSKKLKGLDDLKFIKKNNQESLYVSYCLINKFSLNFFGVREGVVYLLGYDYLSILDFVKNKTDLSLLDFGNALCEESRVKILELLLEREEVTCKDLEKIFSFSGSTAYHHITMLTRIGLVKTRNEGKTILYGLNRKYFSAIIGVLSRYSER